MQFKTITKASVCIFGFILSTQCTDSTETNYIVLNDSTFIFKDNQLMSDTIKISYGTFDSLFKGIFILEKSNEVNSKAVVLEGNNLLLCIRDLNYSSLLFNYNLKNKAFALDSVFNRPFIYSEAGFFIFKSKDSLVYTFSNSLYNDSLKTGMVFCTKYHLGSSSLMKISTDSIGSDSLIYSDLFRRKYIRNKLVE